MKLASTISIAATLGLLASAPAIPQTSAPAVYIHAGALLDRPGQAPRGASTIIVREGRVEAVRDGLVAPEGGARLVDLSKQFVLPGLIDMHVHIFNDDDKMRARLEQNNRDIEDNLLIGVGNARRTLEAGFTTVRDLGSDVRSVTALRDAILTGAIPGPTIVAAGRGMSITGGHGDGSNNTNRDITQIVRERSNNNCNGADECRRAVREQISQGADVIKFAATGGVNSNIAGGLNQQMFADEMKAIIDTAHMFGRKVAAHAHGQNGIKAALEAGVDSIEHGTYTDAQTNALFKKSGAWLVPTMIAPHAALAQARAGARSKNTLMKAEEAVAAHGKNIGEAIKDGVRIAFGTDTGVSDQGKNAQEFALLVKAGMTPASAIRAATLDAATLLDRVTTIGSIEPGKDADIIAVAVSPLNDVTELERIRFVMRRGVVHRLDGARQVFPVE
jgi:imidazolonepropionase-like amidohydrolase